MECGSNSGETVPTKKPRIERKKGKKIVAYSHHKRGQLCHNRLPYRRSKRKETAVKVFTVADESTYLLIQKVPQLSGVNVEYDLKCLCYKYGQMVKFELVDYPENEPFTDTYLVKYETLTEAIQAKKSMDDRELLGNILHVCYAPEQESAEETMEKVRTRQKYVQLKMAQMKNLQELQK